MVIQVPAWLSYHRPRTNTPTIANSAYVVWVDLFVWILVDLDVMHRRSLAKPLPNAQYGISVLFRRRSRQRPRWTSPDSPRRTPQGLNPDERVSPGQKPGFGVTPISGVSVSTSSASRSIISFGLSENRPIRVHVARIAARKTSSSTPHSNNGFP